MESNHPNTVPQQPDHEEMHCIHQIKKELSLDSTLDAVKLVASVLHALRQTLDRENATKLMNKLPDFLKLTFASNWMYDEATVQVNHLDEFVCLVMDRDRESQRGLFKDEVQTLSVINLTMKKLQKLVDLENFEGLSAAMRQELKDATSEAEA